MRTSKTDIPLTPAEREAKKSKEDRAEDIAYTINHALACTATDFIDAPLGHWTQNYLGRRFSVGCGHPDHHHHQNHRGWHWWLGEFAGDFGAVLPTVALQRYAPSFMDVLRKGMEPLLGPLFRFGARLSAQRWAAEQGLSTDSPEYAARVQTVYRHEIEHLPQALMWTASSVAINIGTQKLAGNKGPIWQLVASKATGATVSAGLVVGGRGLMPGVARKWDQFTSRKLFLPATKAVGGLFGVDEAAVSRMAEKQEMFQESNWVDRAQDYGVSKTR